MQSMERQQSIEESISCPKSDNHQYSGFLFGTTSSSSASNLASNSSNINNNSNTRENTILTTVSSSEGQVNMSDNQTGATDQPSSEMDITGVDSQPTGVPCNSDQMMPNGINSGRPDLNHSEPTDTMESQENIQSIVTNNAEGTDGQYMNVYDYCCQVLGHLSRITNDLQPVLIKYSIPIEDAADLLQNLQNPSSQPHEMVFRKPLETLADMLQLGSSDLLAILQLYNIYPVGAETREIAEQRISALNEHNNEQLNKQLQTPMQSNVATSSTSQEAGPATLPISLSRLLSQARRIVQELTSVQLTLVEQPQQFWKKRSMNCLRNNWCPPIQGRSGIQRHYIAIKWSELRNCNWENLLILVQLLSHDSELHPTKVLVPPGTKVRQREQPGKKRKRDTVRPTLDDLMIEDIYGFEKNTRSILCSITEREYNQCKKSLKVIMFNLYKTSAEFANGAPETNDEASADEEEEEEENISVEDQLHKLCKLRICLCRRTDNEELEIVSNLIDTELIEESKGTKELAIDPSEVTPKCLCQCGNEKITVTLNTDSEKDGFVVHLNEEKLNAGQIRGVKEKQISFQSRPKRTPEQQYLHVQVAKTSISKTIKQNHNPYDGLDENELLNLHIVYVDYSENPHEHLTFDMIE